jgi:hypothetical protein
MGKCRCDLRAQNRFNRSLGSSVCSVLTLEKRSARSRNETWFGGRSSMWAPFLRAKPALECGRSSYRLPLWPPTALKPQPERERR